MNIIQTRISERTHTHTLTPHTHSLLHIGRSDLFAPSVAADSCAYILVVRVRGSRAPYSVLCVCVYSVPCRGADGFSITR